MAKIKVCKNSNEFTNVCVLTDESQTIRYGVIGTKRYILGDRARYYLKINEKTNYNFIVYFIFRFIKPYFNYIYNKL